MTETKFVLADVDGEELHVGWPRRDGVFGELAFARVTIAKGEVVSIKFVRELTGEEIAKLQAAPYMRWSALFQPTWQGPESQSWALQLCRSNANATTTAATPMAVRTSSTGDRRVGV